MKNKLKESMNVGEWKYPHNKFIYEKNVLFKNTNVMGNTYFSNYVEWQGEAREQLLLQHPAAKVFLRENPNIVMLTYCVYHRFVRSSYFGDLVRIEVTSRDVQKYSVVLLFKYYVYPQEILIGSGWQKICFGNLVTNEFFKIPQLVLDLVEPILEKK